MSERIDHPGGVSAGGYLKELPASTFDIRDAIPLIVNRESCIIYKTNRYSVPPVFIGKTLTAKPFVEVEKIELFDSEGVSIRVIDCAPAGSRKTFKMQNPEYVAVRNPVFYEQFLRGAL